MISREEAERIMGKPIEQPPISHIYSSSFFDWLEDVSILNFPDIASRILTEEGLFVIHPGFNCSYKLSSDTLHKYIEYVKRLRTRIKSTLSKKTVLVWVETAYKEQTLRFLNLNRDSVILIPTAYSIPKLMLDIVRMEEKQFYRELSKYMKSAGLSGENRYGCVQRVKICCNDFIKTERIKSLTFP